MSKALAADQLIISNTSKDDPATSLTIYKTDDIADDVILADRTQTAYREYKVKVKSSLAESYSLGISKETDLTYQGSDATSVMTSSAAEDGASMPEERWGYTWSENLDADSKALAYKAVTSSVDNFVENQTIDQTYQNNGKLDKDYKLAFAAKFSADQPEGAYSAKVNISLTVTPRAFLTFTLNYDCNGGDDSTCPSAYTTTSQHDSVQVYAQKPTTTPTRTGYTFLGWGNKNDTAERYTPTSNPITINRTSPSATVYAVWKLDRGVSWSGDCGKDIIDNRDGASRAYSTTKITATVDGESTTMCWMTQNLNLNGGTTITDDNSNIVAKTYTLPASSKSGFDSDNTAFVYNSGSTSCDTGSLCYSYYSFMAATAGTGGSSLTSGNAPSDICPKGWRLPTYSEIDAVAGRYYNLFNNTLAGYLLSSKLSNGGLNGYYWSGTAVNNSAYRMNIVAGSGSAGNASKRDGFSIRCVAK